MDTRVVDAGDLRKYRTEIPNCIDDMDLSVYAFRLYVHLKRLDDEGRGKPAGMREMAQHCHISLGSVSSAIRELQAAGLLESMFSLTPEEAVEWIKEKQPQQFGGRSTDTRTATWANLKQTCEWCGCTTVALQAHHYPIPKSEGGTETVNICANCHYEYHTLIRGGFCLNRGVA